MEILGLTLFISLLFALLFVFLFIRDRRLRSFGSAESDALIPFREGRKVDHVENGGQEPVSETSHHQAS